MYSAFGAPALCAHPSPMGQADPWTAMPQAARDENVRPGRPGKRLASGRPISSAQPSIRQASP